MQQTEVTCAVEPLVFKVVPVLQVESRGPLPCMHVQFGSFSQKNIRFDESAEVSCIYGKFDNLSYNDPAP